MVKQSDWELLKTLYNNRSITKTARELYMTQPAVTKRLWKQTMCTPKAQLDLARKCKSGSHHAGGVGCSENHCPNSNLSKQIAAPSKKPDAAIAISLKCFITPRRE